MSTNGKTLNFRAAKIKGFTVSNIGSLVWLHIPYSAEYTRRREHQKVQRGACI